MKTLKRFAMLLFAAAMIFAAASCSKEEGIEESQIVGKWQFPTDVEYSDFKGNTLEINGDHTAIMHISRFEVGFAWTLEGSHFVATREQSGVRADIDFEITGINESAMSIEGCYTLSGTKTERHNITCTVSKLH